jgi:hypothetical protein
MNTENLYNLSLEELNQMARDKGIKFSPGYRGPYKVRESLITPQQFMRTCNPIDSTREPLKNMLATKKLKTKFDKFTDDDLYESYLHEKVIRIFDILFEEDYYKCAISQQKAEEFAKEMNKRHFIIAMQSENPAFPVLL